MLKVPKIENEINEKDVEKSLAKRLIKIENELYPIALKKFLSTNL